MNWHGYTLEEDRHPERPWWRMEWKLRSKFETRERLHFVRTDGRQIEATQDTQEEVLAALDDVDHDHPLPPPEPKCGQVWIRPGCWEQVLIGVLRRSERIVWSVDDEQPMEPWPPPGAVLVQGEGAPWCPPGMVGREEGS